MRRRSFLQFLGLAPAAAVAPKVAEAAQALPAMAPARVVSTVYAGKIDWSSCVTMSCVSTDFPSSLRVILEDDDE